MTKDKFFSDDRDRIIGCDDVKTIPVNTLMLYNLTPETTAYYRDIRVCNELCPEIDLSEPRTGGQLTTTNNVRLKHPTETFEDPFEVFENAIYFQSTLLTIVAAQMLLQ